jgi:hypothetical protein
MVMNAGVCDIVDVSHSHCTVLYSNEKLNSVITLYDTDAVMMTTCHLYSIYMYDDVNMCQ